MTDASVFGQPAAPRPPAPLTRARCASLSGVQRVAPPQHRGSVGPSKTNQGQHGGNMRSEPRSPRRATALIALTACLPLASAGCFGKFELLQKVYRFNQDIDQDKFIQWFAFLSLNLIPIYGFAGLLDTVFFNSIEFWSGVNPVTASADSQTELLVGSNGEVLEIRTLASGTIELRLEQASGRERFIRLGREGEYAVARDAEGELLARVTDRGAGPVLISAPH